MNAKEAMPTPFLHLTFAIELLSTQDLSEALYDRLSPEIGAFLLGNTAPDIQTLTQASRVSTHFYRLRDSQPLLGWESMLIEYPELANPLYLDPARAVFISGYLIHLLWDEMWSRSIYTPFFLDAPWWEDRKTYVLHHNALRVIMDRHAHTELNEKQLYLNQLAGAKPEGWLSFAEDAVLVQWRDWLVRQLQGNAESHTVQVFADRMGVTSQQFMDVIDEVDKHKNSQIPGLASALKSLQAQAFAESIELLLQYWQIDDKLVNHPPREAKLKLGYPDCR